MEIKKIGVLGFGLMGSGIAQACAQAGIETIAREIDQKFIDNGFSIINKNLSRAVKKDKITQADMDQVLGNITGTLNLEDLKDCDLIVEAVIENLDIKNEMYATLDKICSEKTIFASNTSSLTVMSMAASTHRPDRFCGLHFFNPVPAMKLLEVIKTIVTSQETIDTCFEFGKKIGKTTVLAKDNSGFIVNLLLVPYLLDAIRALEQGVASTIDIDTGMKLGCNHPMGPLTLVDFIGIDTINSIAGIMFEEYKEKRYAAPPILKKMVIAGYLGKKSGKGFYDYSGDEPVPTDFGI
ncbi:MAG TPA: 3-hydroxybutyryl-CoA dehydrogenase [Desulfobacteraceae bacterium]|nr:3-hydroxybutyryl-CoA dehydrogenase [Desulfobacteraceae bacterium]